MCHFQRSDGRRRARPEGGAAGDTELAGRRIRAGEKAVLWYVSANRDERVFADPDAFRIDRPNARQHLAFELDVHFCMGSRVAELQLRVLWEEILRRFERVAVEPLVPSPRSPR